MIFATTGTIFFLCVTFIASFFLGGCDVGKKPQPHSTYSKHVIRLSTDKHQNRIINDIHRRDTELEMKKEEHRHDETKTQLELERERIKYEYTVQMYQHKADFRLALFRGSLLAIIAGLSVSLCFQYKHRKVQEALKNAENRTYLDHELHIMELQKGGNV